MGFNSAFKGLNGSLYAYQVQHPSSITCDVSFIC